ncbi:hypothetical protein CMK18_03425 [Candidatus Poribacteria bacterium]|nr:hypothetical protein [Candidatus Poribacteria bacterium]
MQSLDYLDHLNNPEHISLEGITPEEEVIQKIPASFAYDNKVFPVSLIDGVLTVAMIDPLNVVLVDEMRLISGYEIQPVQAEDSEIEDMIVLFYGKTASAILNESIQGPVGAVSTIERETIDDFGINEQDLAQDPTVVHAVEQTIIDAVRVGASDIHIEPFAGEVKIRYRIDGILEEQPAPPSRLQWAITSVIKIMANMNVAERRRPQDGKIALRIRSLGNRQIDLRVSTVPTVHGESVVLRILDKQSISYGLEELGLMEDNHELFQQFLQKPYGIVLATGPTGHGKTTTLYACLEQINQPSVKIITVEDPVEYELEGINQIPVNPEIGVTFAAGLRSILRQDPDTVLVGEIRDLETAEMAIHASLTGHLVFSTLHTNDAPSAITRLINMDVEPYLVASTLEGIIAQRLARRVCTSCCDYYKPSEREIHRMVRSQVERERYLDMDDLRIAKAVGCRECRDRGYSGRLGLFEVLPITEEVRDLTLTNPSGSQLRRLALDQGMFSLRQDGWRKIVDGLTTVDEITRLTPEDEILVSVSNKMPTQSRATA